MDSHTTHFARLEVLIYRRLDAETLPQAQEQALLCESQAASQAWTAGQRAGACVHVERSRALLQSSSPPEETVRSRPRKDPS